MRKKVILFLLACCIISAHLIYVSSSTEQFISYQPLEYKHSMNAPTTEKEILYTIPESLDQSLISVNHLLEQYDDAYGGVTLEGNYIVVHTVGEQQKLSNELSELSKYDNILLRPVQYSIKQLNQAQQRIRSEASIAASYIDIEANQVVVMLNELTEENIQTIIDLLPNEQMVAFVEGEITLHDQAA
ncbi:hypothetical protein [Paenibacillus sp. FSL W7-1287]|uniref:hypothetical protein n=1 Tax=Paenibacillus sp. FSL W7-1287 TaxID=2954538 RepID=UPI0030FBA27D